MDKQSNIGVLKPSKPAVEKVEKPQYNQKYQRNIKEPKERVVGKYQAQEQVLVSRNDVQQKYDDLFLDDWQKLVKQGKNKEAALLAAQQEKEFIEILNTRFDKNTAFSYQEYRESQHRKGLDLNEHFSQAHFRIYRDDLNKLIEGHLKNIQSLEAELEKRNQKLKELEKMETNAPFQKEKLWKEISSEFNRIEELRVKLDGLIQEIPSSEDSLKDFVKKNLDIVDDKIKSIYLLVNELPESLNFTQLDQERRIMMDVLQEISNKFYDLNLPYEDATEVQEKLRKFNYQFGLFFRAPFSLIGTIKEWMETDPNERLDKMQAQILKNMRENHLAFENDTKELVAKEQKRIDFIKANPDFFKVMARSRADILGIENPANWHSEEPSIKLGEGVVVGIIDSFDTCKQTSRILEKSINPDFIGGGCTINYGSSDDGDHGIHVAGIIVSDLIEKNKNSMTIGVAPKAKFEMLNHGALSPKRTLIPLKSSTSATVEWTVQKMAEAINELVHTGTVQALQRSMSDVVANPIVNSSSQILNYSMSTSSLKRFNREWIGSFEGEGDLVVLVQALQSKLLVIALGNDGVDVSSTHQMRLNKALALSSATSPHLLLVANLMQDGLTLNPSSNFPGNEPYIQARTLCAPGTDITSTVLMRSEEASAYKEYSGTSMAAPHVSGVAAVVLSNHPYLTMKELADCLLEGATPLLINDEGVTVELPEILSGEIKWKFNQNPQADKIDIRGMVIKRADWERGQETYGQGRVNLKGALDVAEDKKKEDLT